MCVCVGFFRCVLFCRPPIHHEINICHGFSDALNYPRYYKAQLAGSAEASRDTSRQDCPRTRRNVPRGQTAPRPTTGNSRTRTLGPPQIPMPCSPSPGMGGQGRFGRGCAPRCRRTLPQFRSVGKVWFSFGSFMFICSMGIQHGSRST